MYLGSSEQLEEASALEETISLGNWEGRGKRGQCNQTRKVPGNFGVYTKNVVNSQQGVLA